MDTYALPLDRRACVLWCIFSWETRSIGDRERAEQIRKAIENARCDDLVSEEQAIELKYKGHKKVLDAIAKAKLLDM